ncbi:hypothetical protein RF11_14115 [Thelohanellus kitauei]|uniref:Uncharacterized protein n=1 Tax=Thelohanellus kitauei TaxID=669202 RepID=A0A0C2IN38_THEKT|nr:hypothetical protein RF11_14115 [Thelohanellus kitauei]
MNKESQESLTLFRQFGERLCDMYERFGTNKSSLQGIRSLISTRPIVFGYSFLETIELITLLLKLNLMKYNQENRATKNIRCPNCQGIKELRVEELVPYLVRKLVKDVLTKGNDRSLFRIALTTLTQEQGLAHLVAYEIDRFIHEDPKWMENELFSARSLVRLCKRVRRMKSNGYKIGDAECLKWAKEVQDCIENRWEDLLPRLSSDTASFEDLIKKFEERNIQ